MSESRDLNKNTFLSRVFGLNSTYDDNDASNNGLNHPLLLDDNENYINSLSNTTSNLRHNRNYDSNDDTDEEDDEEDGQIMGSQGSTNNGGSSHLQDHSHTNLLQSHYKAQDDEDDDGLITSFAIKKSPTPGKSNEYETNGKTNNQLRPSVTIHSEDESDESDSDLDEFQHDIHNNHHHRNSHGTIHKDNNPQTKYVEEEDDDDDDEEDEPFDSVIISRPNQSSNRNGNSVSHDNLESLEDGFLDNVSESLLFQNATIMNNNTNTTNSKLNPPKTRLPQGLSPGILKNKSANYNSNVNDGNPFAQQHHSDNIQQLNSSTVNDNNFNMSNMAHNLTEQAKSFASKTMEHLPKVISFQLPTSSSSNKTDLPMYNIPMPNTNQNSNANVLTHTKKNANAPPLNSNEERKLRQKFGILSPMERTLWIWSNISNLDQFLQDVYDYYTGNGYYCILSKSIYDILTIVFIVWLSSFMGNCVDYNKLMYQRESDIHRLDQVIVPQCYAKIPFIQKCFYFVLLVILGFKIKSLISYIKDLKEIKNFYNLLLNIDDDELQTISWPMIVQKIMILRDQNTNALISGVKTNTSNRGKTNRSNNKATRLDEDLKSKTRLNAHDIANRLMRKDNYMIAIFNKNLLKQALSVSIPYITSKQDNTRNNDFGNDYNYLSNASKTHGSYFITRTLEWNLKLCIFDFLFNENGHLKHAVLSEQRRLALSDELKKRFKLAGLLSIVITPFLVLYFLLYYFLKFFYDFKSNPALMSSREYSPYAKWKLREFNELPHIFKRRLNLSNESALNYINQFPKERSNITLKFISFISGSLLTILVILTVLDPENFLNFELTSERTVLFYMSVLTAIFTISKSGVTDTSTVFDPEASLRYVAQFTHYLPNSWEGRYHTEEVKDEFCSLFNLRIVSIVKEMMSLILLPYLLLIKLPDSSEKIVDFFREFSVHVDGLGYVCTFAMFKFDGDSENSTKDKPNVLYHQKNRDGNGSNINNDDDDDELLDEYYSTNDDKMVKSYLYFLESYGNEPVRQKQPQQRSDVGKEKQQLNNGYGNNDHGNGLSFRQKRASNKMKSSLLHSAVLNNRQAGLSNSIYRNHANIGVGSGGPSDMMEETTAGLGVARNPRNSNLGYGYNYNDLNDSLLLSESYQLGFPTNALLTQDYENPIGKRKVQNRSGVDDTYGNIDDDEDEGDNNYNKGGGVLGMINQVYKRKDNLGK